MLPLTRVPLWYRFFEPEPTVLPARELATGLISIQPVAPAASPASSAPSRHPSWSAACRPGVETGASSANVVDAKRAQRFRPRVLLFHYSKVDLNSGVLLLGKSTTPGLLFGGSQKVEPCPDPSHSLSQHSVHPFCGNTLSRPH